MSNSSPITVSSSIEDSPSKIPLETGEPSRQLLLDQTELARGCAKFAYSSEPLIQGEIRLLEIYPGERTECIRSRMFRASLSADVSFEALSYVWQPPDLPESARDARPIIECNGASFEISFNLYCALLNLRDKYKPKTLWVDAVCINQENVFERGQQVSIMSEIYTSASCVNVWLGFDGMGLARRTIEMMLDTLDLFKAFGGGHWQRLEEPKYHTLIRKFDRLLGTSKHDDASPPESQHRYKAGVRQVFGKAWYDRVWVQSEISLAHEACAYWGTRSISWTSLMDFALIQCQLRSAAMSDEKQISTLDIDVGNLYLASLGPERVVTLLNNLWYTYGKDWAWVYKLRDVSYWDSPTLIPVVGLLNVLYTSTTFGATDPRDHIYAFKSHPAVRPLFEQSYCVVSYDMPVSDLYFGIARYLLDESQSLHLLSCVRRGLDWTPTWVPHWHAKRDHSCPLVRYPGRSPDSFHASEGYASVLETRQLLFRIKGYSLQVRGAVVHDITAVYPISPKGFHEHLRKSADAAMNEEAYTLESLRWKAFCDTISVGGKWGSSEGKGVNPDNLSIQLLLVVHNVDKSTPESVRSAATLADTTEAERIVIGGQVSFQNQPCLGRAFFLTRDGNMGLGPLQSRPGDKCCIVFGAQTPFVLRPCGGDQYKVVEECYISDLMRGEGIDMIREGRLEQTTFELI